MPGITHLKQFQKPALQRLVDLSEKNKTVGFADKYLPTVPTPNRQFAYDIVRNNEYIAAYIGFGAEAPFIDRDEIASKMGTIAYFGLADQVDYEELQAIYEAKNQTDNPRLVFAIDAVTRRNMLILDGLRRLMYLAKMEALFKGEHEFSKGDGEKNQVLFRFGVPAENKIALTVGNDFSNLDFDIIAFFLEHIDRYQKANGGRTPEEIVGSAEIQGLMLRNNNLIVESGRPAGSARISVAQMNEVFSDFGIPPFTVITDRTISYVQNGSKVKKTKEVVPVNRITFLSRGIGEYLMGPTLENEFAPGLNLNIKDYDDPIRSRIRGVGAGFPAPSQPSLIYHLDVYTP